MIVGSEVGDEDEAASGIGEGLARGSVQVISPSFNIIQRSRGTANLQMSTLW